eukprot:scaffold71951_cov70-Phaeocystis_antarctica.AAC.1
MTAFVRQTAAVIATPTAAETQENAHAPTSIAVEAQEKARAPTFQIQVKVDGATVMLDAGSAWTAADVKAALHTKTGRASGGYYLVAGGGKPLNDSATTTFAALGVGPGDQLELRGRLRGGMGCVTSRLGMPSYWDEVGTDKPNASALKATLADTVLVDAAWLAQLADAGGVLPRCQDLPLDARVTLEEMEKWKDKYTVGVLVISYPWWALPHSTLA